jgi:tRNA-dihydrouridine synthase A
MMDRTDRYFRGLVRHLTRRTQLWSEMVTAAAIVHGGRDDLLRFDAELERPVVLQLGGDDPALLAEAARRAADIGYDELNLNCGCPSPRVQRGAFGVVLMGRPDQAARCVEAMARASGLPVSVKHRVGFDELDRYEDMLAFVDRVAAAGCQRVTVHARKAWTEGLSPAQNREIPPLQPELALRLKAERPALRVELNGGIRSLAEAERWLAAGLDSVMIGRAAWDNPWLLHDADRRLHGEAEDPAPSRVAAVRAWLPTVERELARGARLHALVRPVLNLFVGQPGGRRFRRVLSEGHARAGAGVDLIELALGAVEEVPA